MGVAQGERSVFQIVLHGAADQLDDGAAALPQGRGHAVAGGVPGAHDDHVPPLRRGDRRVLAELLALHGGLQELRAVVNPGNALRLQAQGPGALRAAAEDHRVIVPQQPPGHRRVRRVHAGDEADPLVGHQAEPAVHHVLGQLHVGDAVGQKAAAALLPLHHRDGVAPAVQLVRRRQARRAGAHDADLLPGPLGRAAALHRPGGEGVLNDAELVVPDGDGVPVQPADAGPLAGGGADPARELREIVGLQQAAQGVEGVPRPDHVVPLGNQIVEGTAEGPSLPLHARLAVGDAAVHAPPPLLPPEGLRQGDVKGLPVPDPLLRGPAGGLLPRIVQKSCCLSHVAQPPQPLVTE